MIRLALAALAVVSLVRRADRISRAEIRVGALEGERDELILELAEVRKSWMQCIEERNCAREVAEGTMEENATYREELKALRGKAEARKVAN